jgi:hypothetical protein
MKLKAVTVSGNAGSGAHSREPENERINRIARHFAKPENQVYVPLGKLFSIVPELAVDLLKNGKSIPVTEIDIEGKTFPVREGFTISLANIKVWGCVACGSAEGTAVFPSPRKGGTNPRRFAELTDWYYVHGTRELVCISQTCFSKYIAVEHKARILSGADYLKFLAARQAPAQPSKKTA